MSALQGKVALVTGGAGGLGTAISRMLLALKSSTCRPMLEAAA